MKTRVRTFVILIAAACIVAMPADTHAQEEGSTPGAIPDPGTYQGSMELQRREQQQDQQTLQRLNDNYQQYAPSGSGSRSQSPATRGKAPVDWWSKPPLPPANNPLLGRWKQTVAKGVAPQQLAGAAVVPGAAEIAASLLNSTLAGGCKSMFGSGVVAFEPNELQWVASDGHEEILNNVAYRASGSEIVVLSHDPGAMPALIFGFSSHDQAVVAFFNCTMNRLGAKPPATASTAAPSATPKSETKPPVAPDAAPPSGPANAVLKFHVGTSAQGSFAPLPGLHVWVTSENPEDAMAKARLIERDNTFTTQVLGDCTNAMACTRDLKVMTAKALGSILTDADGRAQTPTIPSGRYYLVGIAPYNGKVIFWSQPVDLQSGTNSVTLDQTNGSVAR